MKSKQFLEIYSLGIFAALTVVALTVGISIARADTWEGTNCQKRAALKLENAGTLENSQNPDTLLKNELAICLEEKRQKAEERLLNRHDYQSFRSDMRDRS